MQSYGASLMLLRILGEVILEEYTSDYRRNMWKSG